MIGATFAAVAPKTSSDIAPSNGATAPSMFVEGLIKGKSDVRQG
jgi:hypothetical protein